MKLSLASPMRFFQIRFTHPYKFRTSALPTLKAPTISENEARYFHEGSHDTCNNKVPRDFPAVIDTCTTDLI